MDVIVLAQDLNLDNSSIPEVQNQDDTNAIENLNFDESFTDAIILNLNSFVLAWSIFYSIFFLFQFFYYRLYYSGGELSNEKNGMRGLDSLLGLWWRYIFCLVFLVSYGFSKGTPFVIPVTLICVLVYLAKLYLDLGKILDLIDYFSWSKNIVDNLKSLLKLK